MKAARGAVIRLRTKRAFVRGDIGFDAENGLDARGRCRRVKLDGRVEIAVVRDGDGVHAQFLDAFHQLWNGVAAIQQRVFGMQVEVGEAVGCLGHGDRAIVPCTDRWNGWP